jgi:hypothetical protein
VTQRSAKDMLRSLPRFAEGGEAGESLEETQKRLDAQRELFKSLEQQKSQFDAYQTAQEINRIEQERYAELQADIEKNPYKNVDRSRYLIQKGIRAPTRVTMGDKVYTVGPPSGMISSTSGGVLPEEYRIVDKDGKQRQEDIVLQRRRVAGPAPSAFALEKPEFDASGYQKALTDLEVLQKQYADMLYRPTPRPASPPFPPPPPPAPTLVQEPVLPPQNLPPVVASVEPAARVDRGPRSIRAAQAAANLTPGVGVDLGFGYFDRLGNYIPAAKIVPIEEDMTNIPVADTVRPVESGIRGGLSPIAQMSIPAADISSVYSLRPMDPMGDLSLPENRNLMPGVGVDTSQGYYDRLGNFIAAPNLQPIGIGTTPVFSYREGGEVDAFIQRANGGSASSSGVRRLKMSGYQAGGDVTDEMFVGTAPSEESQQTTGEYIKGLYKENIPVHARVYLETLLGKKDPITAEDFTKDELADIEKLLSSKPAKGAVTEYSDYEKVRDLDREGRHSSDWLENLPSVGKTLGRFTYETLPDGRRVIKDTYDFYNTSRSINVQEFEEMGPAEKALAVFKKITAGRSMMDPPFVKRAADVLGEAYIGRDGRPVKVEYDPKDLPVKRQEGSPPEGEVNENPYVRMAREERAAQDKAFDSVNRQLSDLLKRYKEGDEGITEKDLLPFFPGYNEYDIAQMYGTTTESSVPSMSSKARSFTPEIMSNLRKHDELMQKDFDRLVKEKRLPRDVITARTLGLAKGGDVSNDEFIQEMMTGTRPTDETTSPGILPPEIRQAIDVPLDFANLLIRGTAAVPIGGAAGLYKGITGGKYGTQEGVKEADTEAARMMAKITGEPKTQTAKDVLQFVGDKMQEYKLDAALPQLLTLPSPGPGAASALMRSYELAETPPLGTVKLTGDKGVKPATPPTDQMGFYSPAEKAVMGLPQDKGTASQMLAQITKTQGVKPVELRATGLEDYLKGKGNEPVTKQEIQDFLTNNRVEVDEVVLGKGLSMSPEAKRLMEDAEKRMMEADQVMAPFFEQSRRQEFNRLARSLDPAINESSYSQQTEGSFLQGQEPYSMFYRIRGPLSRKIAGGDQGALEELDALNLPPDIRQAAIDFADAKTEYIKYSKQARKMEKPKFDQYNIPGGTNAREIYLTLPGVKENNLLRSETARLDELAQKRLGSSLDGLSPAEQSEYFSLIGKREKAGASFTAPGAHSVSPEADKNRLAHIFLDERKDAKGNNVLFVQELQSDWAQTGRDKGFVPKDLSAVELKAIVNTSANKPYYEVRTVDNQFVANVLDVPVAEGNEGRAVIEVQRVLQNRGIPGAVSPAPFVTNTEDWVNLALKRVIKEAVDNDIDTVAFIRGEQAADKYSLRTVVDTIEVKKATEDGMTPVFITPKGKTTPFRLLVDKKGVVKDAPTSYQNQFLGQPLSLVLGKDASEEILSGGSRVIKTEDMAFGGKGMEGFYDNILPKTAEKLLKKLGGGKVEPVEMVKAAPSQMPYEANAFLHWMSFRHPGTSRSDAARAWGMGMDNNQFVKEFYEETTPKADQYLGFKITPEMKEMVKTEGLPKFAAGGEVTDFIKRAA